MKRHKLMNIHLLETSNPLGPAGNTPNLLLTSMLSTLLTTSLPLRYAEIELKDMGHPRLGTLDSTPFSPSVHPHRANYRDVGDIDCNARGLQPIQGTWRRDSHAMSPH